MDICAVVMAAGEGTRMNSKHSKVIHRVAGKPMISWVAEALTEAGAKEQLYIVGFRQEEVRAVLGEDVAFVLQEKQLGTGHAVMQAAPFLEGRNGCTIVATGDAPMITADTLRKALAMFEEGDYGAVVITAKTATPGQYGRVIRNHEGNVQRIVEAQEATPEEKAVEEINSSIYFYKTPLLLSALGRMEAANKKQEYYLPDTIEILIKDGQRVGAFVTEFDEIRGINDRIDLHEIGCLLNRRICRNLMLSGVQIVDVDSTWIDPGVTIGRDTIIRPFTLLKGDTHIGEDCIIGPQSRLQDVTVGDGTTFLYSVASQCEIGRNCRLGPFSHVRPDSKLGDNITIGAYVEIKNSSLGDYTRAVHHTYIGDAQVGKNVNFGCGTVTCNYDGLDKTDCIIGDNVFIGGNSNLISPVVLHDNSYVAAGSTITDDVPPLSLAIARNHQVVKENWVLHKNRIREAKLMPTEREW